MKTVIINITNASGLHARPAATFVKEAAKFKSKLRFRNLTTASAWADAKSILSVLSAGVEKGHQIELEAEGADEAEAVQAVEGLARLNFGEG